MNLTISCNTNNTSQHICELYLEFMAWRVASPNVGETQKRSQDGKKQDSNRNEAMIIVEAVMCKKENGSDCKVWKAWKAHSISKAEQRSKNGSVLKENNGLQMNQEHDIKVRLLFNANNLNKITERYPISKQHLQS